MNRCNLDPVVCADLGLIACKIDIYEFILHIRIFHRVCTVVSQDFRFVVGQTFLTCLDLFVKIIGEDDCKIRIVIPHPFAEGDEVVISIRSLVDEVGPAVTVVAVPEGDHVFHVLEEVITVAVSFCFRIAVFLRHLVVFDERIRSINDYNVIDLITIEVIWEPPEHERSNDTHQYYDKSYRSKQRRQ